MSQGNHCLIVCLFSLFRNSASIVDISLFGQGNGSIWLKSDNCTVSEEDVMGCFQNDLHMDNCGHDKDTAIRCGGFCNFF
jgi:hypothetical protein